ncbi:putative short-chain dehydrogenase/reductase [Dietzia sp. NCCP-2495]|uniref:SDR family oxidoreductase n=1 Tax=Dietzia sp. NCCP-2495 TaxID=2934675 RepID=UPI00223036BA|nr:SDR family oxidoreductase [Dietzia sp. NCCP-2495]GLB64188.1 putative short-chain dehydrogenase/reductase [Dietzia sp. NCCP-2495]
MPKRRIKDYRDTLCVVTGAASGIGRSTAIRLAGEGARLVLTDVKDEGLQATARDCEVQGAAVLVSEALDLTDHEAVTAFGEKVIAEHGAPDAILHVAGNSAWGRPDVLEHRVWRSMVEVNLMGTIHVIEAFIPAMMVARKPAALVMVSSAAGLLGLPWHAAYSAAKFGIRGIAEVLRFDLAPYDIGVHLVCPGAVDTPLVGTIEIAGVDRSDPEVAKTAAQFQRHAVTPDQAAESMLEGVRKGRYLIYTSPDIRLAFAAQKFAPPAYRLAMKLISRKINKAAAGRLP